MLLAYKLVLINLIIFIAFTMVVKLLSIGRRLPHDHSFFAAFGFWIIFTLLSCVIGLGHFVFNL